MAKRTRKEELTDSQYLTGSEVLAWLVDMNEMFLADSVLYAETSTEGEVKRLSLVRDHS